VHFPYTYPIRMLTGV